MTLKMPCRKYCCKIIYITLFLFSSMAYSAVEVTIPNLTGLTGSDKNVPVLISGASGEDIYSVGAEITFNADVIEVKEIIVSGTLLESWGSPTTNNTTGTIMLAAAGSSPLSGDGIIFYINITVKGAAGTNTNISFKNLILNEGNPTVTPHNGSFTVVAETYGSILEVLPDTLHFNATIGKANPADQSIFILNAGTGVLDWTALESLDWLTLSQYSGLGADTMTVSVEIGSLSAGTYYESIIFSATGAESSPQSVMVIFNILPETTGSILEVHPGTLYFYATSGEANPVNQSINILNAGTGVLDWSIVESLDWLTLDQYSGKGSATINVSVNINDMNAGTFSDSIVISAAGAISSPQSVIVILYIEPPIFNIVGMPDSSAEPDAHITLPISISDITGQDIHAVSFSLKYNPVMLEARGVYSKDALTEQWGAPEVTISNGQVQARIEGSTPLAGSGALCWVEFHVLGLVGSNCEIGIDEFLLNDATDVDSIKNSTIEIIEPNDVTKNTNTLPDYYFIWQNYPNPFNPATCIKYQLPEPTWVKIDIYDVCGKHVKNLANKYQHSGIYEITWHGDDKYNRQVPSGMYYYRFESDKYNQARIMTLIK